MSSQCQHSYHKSGYRDLLCRILRDGGEKWPFCKHQYYCGKTHQNENTSDWSLCKEKAERQDKE